MSNLRSRGFTLIEIMIALLIFSLVMTMLFVSLRAFLKSSRSITASVESLESTSSAIKRIKADFEQLFMTQYPRYRIPEFGSSQDAHRFEGTQEFVDGTEVSQLTFSTLAHAATDGTQLHGVARVTYFVKKNDKGFFDLYRSDMLMPFLKEDIFKCTHPVLARDLKGFVIIYTDHEGETSKVWNSDADDNNYEPPASVEFQLITGDPQNTETHSLTVAVSIERKGAGE